MDETVDHPPSLMVSVLQSGFMGEGLVGSYVRMNDRSPELWALNFVAGSATSARIVDGLAVHLMDSRFGFLPWVLLPYSPPQVLVSADGALLSPSGEPLRRGWLATLRCLRIRIRAQHEGLVEQIVARVNGDDDASDYRLPSDHEFFHPAVTAYFGPSLPLSLLSLET